MFTIFEKLLLGHLIGDYLLQPKAMAIAKSAKGLTGWTYCLAHCLIYTLSICLMTATVDPLKIALIFCSHFPVDRWSLADLWLKQIRGRSLKEAFCSTDPLREVDVAFSAIVYTVVDNTIHLLLMAAIFKFF
ncbi:MAG: DUF3307 domain-containing protein [Candidatus Falkowbacteria bacterium]